MRPRPAPGLPAPPPTARVLRGPRHAYRTAFAGLPVTIEQAPGEERRWKQPGGREGRTVMGLPYGYLRGTLGLDGDQVDVFLGPREDAREAYVVTQMRPPEFREVDEQKVLLGFGTAEEAKAAYLIHYDDPRFFGWMTTMPMEAFRSKVMATRKMPGLVKSKLGLLRRRPR